MGKPVAVIGSAESLEGILLTALLAVLLI